MSENGHRELPEAFVLSTTERKRAASRSVEVSVQGLRDLERDPTLGHAAATALRCVEERGADPRLLLLVIEAAEEGLWWQSETADAERSRARRNGEGKQKRRSLHMDAV
jgi:hypothetical protein